MARFRDTQILKKLTTPEYTIEHEAQLFLFLAVEQKLRKVIQEAQKYQNCFKRQKLTRLEVDLAIKDQNQNVHLNVSKTQMMGFNYMESATLTKKRDTFVLNERVSNSFYMQKNCDLKDVICAELKQITMPISYPILQVYYVLREGKMTNIPETQHLLRLNDVILRDQNEAEESRKQFAVVKDSVNQILSPFQQDYLRKFFELFNQHIQKNIKEFNQFTKHLQHYQEVAGVLPFLVKFFYSFCDTSGICSYYTKTSIMDCIESLLLNKHVNLDYHLHSFLKMLVLFLTSQVNSGSMILDQQFYMRVSRALRFLTFKYNEKYLLLKANFKIMLNRLLQDQFDELKNQDHPSYHSLLICNAIIEFFQEESSTESLKYLYQMMIETQKLLKGKKIDFAQNGIEVENDKKELKWRREALLQKQESEYVFLRMKMQLQIAISKMIRSLPDTEATLRLIKESQDIIEGEEIIFLNNTFLSPQELFITI